MLRDTTDIAPQASERPTRPRLSYVDLARGVAMACIVLGHMGMREVNHVVFTFHVTVFYVITGYFTSTNDDLRTCVAKRARSLLVPYVITATVIVCGKVLVHKLFYDGTSSWVVLRTWALAALWGAGDPWEAPIVVRGIGAIWFLWATFWGSVALRWLLDRKWQVRLALVLAIFAASEWSVYVWHGWLPLSVQAGGCGLLFMYVGHLWREFREAVPRPSAELKAATLLVACAVWAQFLQNFKSFWLVHCDVGRGTIDIVGTLCACYVVVRLCEVVDRRWPTVSAPIGWLGRNSLYALCVHDIALEVIRWDLFGQATAAMGPAGALWLKTLLNYAIVLVGTWAIVAVRNVRKKAD